MYILQTSGAATLQAAATPCPVRTEISKHVADCTDSLTRRSSLGGDWHKRLAAICRFTVIGRQLGGREDPVFCRCSRRDHGRAPGHCRYRAAEGPQRHPGGPAYDGYQWLQRNVGYRHSYPRKLHEIMSSNAGGSFRLGRRWLLAQRRRSIRTYPREERARRSVWCLQVLGNDRPG